jgi:hypothetical protein
MRPSAAPVPAEVVVAPSTVLTAKPSSSIPGLHPDDWATSGKRKKKRRKRTPEEDEAEANGEVNANGHEHAVEEEQETAFLKKVTSIRMNSNKN